MQPYELAREFKGGLDSGKTTRRPHSSQTVGDYFAGWLDAYRGRTSRGLEESTRREYEISFKLHILPLIGRMRMRDLAAPDVRELFVRLERKGASPSTIRRAKAALSVMLACAVEDGDTGSNPAAGVRYVPTEAAKRRHAKPAPKRLGAADTLAVLEAMPDGWAAFFYLLAHTGVRVGELLGLTWQHVHLGDDAHIMVAEQVYRGRRKRLKTDASRACVPLSPGMASWLGEMRPRAGAGSAPVFASRTGEPLNYANVYNRVLRPALVKAGVAVKVGEVKVKRRDGEEEARPIYDYRGVAFHAFRHACATVLDAHGKREKQVQGWLRHSQISTTRGYVHQADDGLGGAEFLDEILPPRGQRGANEGPETAANDPPAKPRKTASQSQTSEQPRTAESA